MSDYFKNITPFELARRQEVDRFVSAKRKLLCDEVIRKHEEKKQLKKDDKSKPVTKKRK